MNPKLLTFLILCFIIILVQSEDEIKTKEYLYKYGFLNSMGDNNELLKDAFKKFQRTFNLTETGILDEATKASMATKRRCGKPDDVPSVDPTRDTWVKRHLTYKIQNSTNSLTKADIKNAMDNAISLWTKDIHLNITESNTNESDIDIYFTKQDGEKNILGYAFFPENGTMYLDKDEDWTLNESLSDNRTSFQWVAIHEIGHSLGLSHTNNSASIMFPYYSPEVAEPTEQDKNSLKQLYPKLSCNTSLLRGNYTIDAFLMTIDREYLFKDDKLWLLKDQTIQSGPYSLNSLYIGLPSKIDCAFSFGKVTFIFKGDTYYKYTSNNYIHKKKTISKHFDNLPPNIDAAFVNYTEKNIYFFKTNKFYKFNYNTKKLDNGTAISDVWPGVPDNIEAATMLEGNLVLFIKETICYIFDTNNTTLSYNIDCGKIYFKCPESLLFSNN